MLISITLLSSLLFITVSFYPLAIKIYSANKDEFEARTEVLAAKNLITNYLNKANTFTIANQGRITFTANIDPATPDPETGIFYFYNASDSTWPTTYNYTSYELRYTETGIFGSGRAIIHNLNPPPASSFSNNVNQITINLSATNYNTTYESRFILKPRNL